MLDHKEAEPVHSRPAFVLEMRFSDAEDRDLAILNDDLWSKSPILRNRQRISKIIDEGELLVDEHVSLPIYVWRFQKPTLLEIGVSAESVVVQLGADPQSSHAIVSSLQALAEAIWSLLRFDVAIMGDEADVAGRLGALWGTGAAPRPGEPGTGWSADGRLRWFPPTPKEFATVVAGI